VNYAPSPTKKFPFFFREKKITVYRNWSPQVEGMKRPKKEVGKSRTAQNVNV
jgi:hypothetical protein